MEGGGGFGLDLESELAIRIVLGSIQAHLQGDATVEPELLGLVDDGHPAGAQLSGDRIARDHRIVLPRRRGGPIRGGRGLARVRSSRVARSSRDGLERAMERDLDADALGELREAKDIFLEIGRLAQALPEHEFVVDQVQCEVGIIREDGESLEIPFRRDAESGPPSVPLVGAEDRGKLGRLETLLLVEERREVRREPGLPESQEPSGRRAGSLRGRRRGSPWGFRVKHRSRGPA